MGLNFGPKITRALSAQDQALALVAFIQGLPVMDADLDLAGEADQERHRRALQAMMPSGFLADPTRGLDDYEFSPMWSNLFALGRARLSTGREPRYDPAPPLWAVVNGWVIPVTGTDAPEGDPRNLLRLYPPPESGGRIDVLFLEAWRAVVDAQPSAVNKPSAGFLWRYGNVKYGGTNIPDDIAHPFLKYASSRRIQVQYRIRVHGQGSGRGAGAALDVYPDGLGDPNILGQGAAGQVVGGMVFRNMASELGDPGLYRAGDGNPSNGLGTVDGYTYAVPICAVFRRNSSAYTAIAPAGNPNQGGAVDRNPRARLLPNPLDGARTLSQVTLAQNLLPLTGVSGGATLQVNGLAGSGIDDPGRVPQRTFIQIDDEVIGIASVDPVAGTITIPGGNLGRARWDTADVGHLAGAQVRLYNTRPNGLYADQVVAQDVLDLRHAVTDGEWDYSRLLAASVGMLLRGELRTAWKRSAPGDTEGPVVHEVDWLQWNGLIPPPNYTEALDGPDGIRWVWSDSAAPQPDVTLLLDNAATTDQNRVGLTTADQFDTTARWDIGADLKPTGFLNVAQTGLKAFTNGSVVFLHIGGETGSEGARGTTRDGSVRAVRFLTPREQWRSDQGSTLGSQQPVSVRFLGVSSQEAPPPGLDPKLLGRHPGPMAPSRASGFEQPFVVLGGLLHPSLRTSVPATALRTGAVLEIDLGINFDAPGLYFSMDAQGGFGDDPTLVSRPLRGGRRTLYGMLTNGGIDRTGADSEIYVVMYGDAMSTQNNGAFRVVGAGTVGYTSQSASSSTSLVVVPLSADFSPSGFDPTTKSILTVEVRSQQHNADDPSDYGSRLGDLAVVLTDLGGLSESHAWNRRSLGYGTSYDLSLPPDPKLGLVAVAEKLLLNLTLLYHPGRGGTARVASQILRVALRSGGERDVGGYLKQDRAEVDPLFPSMSGSPAGEVEFHPAHVQTWNRLSALGLRAPQAPDYGGHQTGGTEAQRETQLFVDPGSKTVVFRPYRRRELTTGPISYASILGASQCLLGGYVYPSGVPKDGLQIFTGTPTSGKKAGMPVPWEVMPRFGRLDIPCYNDVQSGKGPFLSGINHLFCDGPDPTDPTFQVIGGGRDNTTGGAEATLMYFSTAPPTAYGTSSTVIGGINNLPNIAARKTTKIDPNTANGRAVLQALRRIGSSDRGRGLRGIQLPPYYGIARLLGVYEFNDFKNHAGRTFRRDRIRVEDQPATNLLRQDAEAQSLYLLQDGALDLTGETGDHTYVIPDTDLDLMRILGWTPGRTFDDYDYVVVCTVFGFAKNWVSGNNLVLLRNHDGTGKALSDTAPEEIDGIKFCIPCAAAPGDELYIAYDRTAYQGDPYGTRNGATRTTSDYELRYGEIPASLQIAGNTPIQQQDESGQPIPQLSNPRALQVLAVMDFATTLGTGKIGGMLDPSTILDAGYTEDTPASSRRLPPSQDWLWRILPRAFTTGQSGSTVRAGAYVDVLDNDALVAANKAGDVYEVIFRGYPDTTPARVVLVTPDMLPFLPLVPSYEISLLDTAGKSESIQGVAADLNFGFLGPSYGQLSSAEVAVTSKQIPALGMLPGSDVLVEVAASLLAPASATPYGGIVLTCRRDGATLYVRAHYMCSAASFHLFPDTEGRDVRNIELELPAAGAGSASTLQIPWKGITPSDPTVPVIASLNPLPPGVVLDIRVPETDLLEVRVVNTTGASVKLPKQKYAVAVLRNINTLDWQANLQKCSVGFELNWVHGSEVLSAMALAQALSAHPVIGKMARTYFDGTPAVRIEAEAVGSEGNRVFVEVSRFHPNPPPAPPGKVPPISRVLGVRSPRPGWAPERWVTTGTYLTGGYDLPTDAGTGITQQSLTGLTERLPLGLLVQDCDFIGESPLRDDASSLHGAVASLGSVQRLLPLTTGGREYDRSLGAPGEMMGLSDGAVLAYVPYTTETPTGSRRFRLFRGGGALYVLRGENPGGPVDWSLGSWPPALQPVLKAGVLVCRAFLVRGFREEAFSPAPSVQTYGDEIQMVVATYGVLGDGNTVAEGVRLGGAISPSGYGEGFAAADRYRVSCRPLYSDGQDRVSPDPGRVELAPFAPENKT